MTSFYLQGLISVISVISLSNFFNKKLNISINKVYLITIIFLSFVLYISNYLNILKLSVYFLCFVSVIFLPYAFSILENRKTNIVFILILFFFLILGSDLFYNDEDELVYWGMKLKFFHMNYGNFLSYNSEFVSSYSNYTGLNFTEYNYHPVGLTVFQYFNSFFSPIHFPQLSIFSNNIILISCFFYIFFESDKLLKSFFKFLIFYALLNLLTFGMLSIYPDPIVASIFGILIFKIYNVDRINKNQVFLIIYLSFYLLIIYSASTLYISIIFLYLIVIIFFKKNYITKNIIIVLVLLNILSFILLKYFAYSIDVTNLIKIENLKHFIIELVNKYITSPIYFSEFLILIKTIFSIVFGIDLSVHTMKINSLIFFASIILMFYFSKVNFTFLLNFIIGFIIVSFAIVTFKINYLSLSPLVYGRYISVFLLGSIICIMYFFLKSNFNKKFIVIILVFLLISPNKVFTLVVPKSYYLKDNQNLNYYINKSQMEKINFRNLKDSDLCIIYDKKIHNYQHSLYTSLIMFYSYPLEVNQNCYLKKQNSFKLKEKSKNYYLFLLNLNENEILNLNDINYTILNY